MGGPNPDYVVMPPTPMVALTLAEIAAARWTLQAHCGVCGTTLRVSLNMLVRVHGPDAVLWGQRPRCPTIREGHACTGRLDYWAQAVRKGSWKKMVAASPREIDLHRRSKDPHERRNWRRVDAVKDES